MSYKFRLSIVAMICNLLLSAAIAQDIQPGSHRGRSSAEALRSYGIDLSRQSLLAALSNANPRVRVLAADQLAYQHDADAIPAVEQAYSVEKDSMTRVGIAAALSSLKDPAGVEYLQTICRDGTLPIKATIAAVQMLELFDASSKECADTIISSLTRPEDADYRAVTLSLLPGIYKQVPGAQRGRIVSTIQNLLIDKAQQPNVLISAGEALAEIGSPSSAAVVRDVLTRDLDPVLRSSLQEDLKAFEKKAMKVSSCMTRKSRRQVVHEVPLIECIDLNWPIIVDCRGSSGV